jgi:glycerophosphoryl diester phosphodiesterase
MINIKKIAGFLLFTSIILNSCQKIKYYPDRDYKETRTLFLAHKAGGNSVFKENTLKAADYGFNYLDGIEVDLQVSKDKTLWLSHDFKLGNCNGTNYNCFPETPDYQILLLDSCSGYSYNFTKLEDIFKLMNSKYKGKFISLDVKAWTPCGFSSSDIIGMMNVTADEIIKLTNKYNLQGKVMVESETATFLNHIKSNGPGIETYLTSLGDFERAVLLTLQSGFTGISFKYKFLEEINSQDIQMIRKKGLKIQLWTVDIEDDLKEAISINPDFIQSDNIDYLVKCNY